MKCTWTMFDKLRLDHFLFEEYKASPSSLAIYRMVYAVFILALYLPEHLWISSFPNSFFNPPIGLTMFFTGFPPAPFFVILNCFSILAVCCLLVGYRTRLASIAVALLLLVGNAWSYSFGKIDGDILLVLIPLVMQFSGWGESYSMDARRKIQVHPSYNAWPLALLALLIGFAMMTAAQPKIAGGWLNPHTEAVHGHVASNPYVSERPNWITAHVLRIKSGAFWESLDYATVLVEGSFLFVVGNCQAFRVACALACFLHLGIALTMEIPFWQNVLAYAAFCNWSVLESRVGVQKALKYWVTLVSRLSVLSLVLSSGVVSLLYLTLGNPVKGLAALIRPEPERILGLAPCLVSAAIASLFLVRQFRKGLGTPRSVSEPHPIIMFDGFCGLCNKWVDFVLKHDRRSLYRFTPLQTATGQDILERFRLPKDFIQSFLLVEGDCLYCRSTGILKVMRGLGPPFSFAYVLILVPQAVRDWVYTLVANVRLQWFGKRTFCRIPTPEERNRFL